MLTVPQKMQIGKFLRNHSIDNIYYYDFINIIGKKDCNYQDILEYLLEFVNTKLKELELNENLLNKYLVLIYNFLSYWDTNIELDSKIVSNTLLIKTNYLNNENKTEELTTNINNIINILNNKFKINTNNEDINKINDLTLKVNDLEKELNDKIILIKKYETKLLKLNKLETNNKEKDKTIKELKSNIKILEDNINKLKIELDNKLKEINDINKNIKEKEINIEKQNKQIDDLNELVKDLNNKNYTLSKTIKELNTLVDNKNIEITNIKNDEENAEIRNKLIMEFILKNLFMGEISIEDLIIRSNNESINASRLELLNALNRLKNTINIGYSEYSFPKKTYTIKHNEILTNQTLTIAPKKLTYYDILFISDLHLYDMDNIETLNNLNKIYEYATKNDIKLILNLGDLIGLYLDNVNLENLCNAKKLLDNIIEKFPKDKYILHAVLGGNHDEEFLKVGLDPIKYISNNRDDILSLGYKNASLKFKNDDDLENVIMLHHINKRIENYRTNKEETNIIDKILRDTYSSLGNKKTHTYLDVLGHFHISCLDSINSYLCVPSLLKDRVLNGAWHAKIFISSNKTIDHIILIPLILQNELIKNTEIVYSKKI